MHPFLRTKLAIVMLLPLCWPNECGGVKVLWRSGGWTTSARTLNKRVSKGDVMGESVVATVLRGLWYCVRGSAYVAFSCLLLPATAQSESLNEALAAAYYTNPTLNAQRAAQQATDEGVPIALSGVRPTVSFNADQGVQRLNQGLSPLAGAGSSSFFSEGKTRPRGYAFVLNQNLFRGFRTINATREAKANVYAGIESLRSVEQTILQDAVTAYIDVLRDQAIVRLRENNVKVLASQLKATKDRFEVGEVTRTDTAQSQAGLSSAQSALSLARSNLKTSRANYEQVIGHPPSKLQLPKSIRRLLPQTQQDAVAIADEENPTILNAVFLAESADFAVGELEGELLPEVTFETEYKKRFESSRLIDDTETTTYLGRVNVPLYQAGSVAAQIRQAKDTRRQRQTETAAARTETRANVLSSWGQLESAIAQIKSDQSSVDANAVALKGVRDEERVGQRTVLDVLDAEQALLDSNVSLVTSRRDKILAEYVLLAAVGGLNSYVLNLPVQHYDPLLHYRRAKFKFLGIGEDSGIGWRDWLNDTWNARSANPPQ